LVVLSRVVQRFNRTVRYLLLLRKILHLLRRIRVTASRLWFALGAGAGAWVVLLTHHSLQLMHLTRVVHWLLLLWLVAVALVLELVDKVLLISGLHSTAWLVEHMMDFLFQDHLVYFICVTWILMVVLTNKVLILQVVVRLFALNLLGISSGVCILNGLFL
jgi:hypothetical protein